MKTYKDDVAAYQRRREADDHYQKMESKRSHGIWIAGFCFVGMLVLILVAVLTN